MSLLFLSLLLLLFLTPLSSATPRRLLQSTNNAAAVACPLNFTALQQLLGSSGSTTPTTNLDTPTRCQYIKQGLRLVESLYLQSSNNFLPPLTSSSSCWASYQSLVGSFVSNFDVRAACGFQTDWISQGCMNITTKAQFESLVPSTALNDVVSACNQSLSNAAPCASCTTSLSTLQAAYLTGGSAGNNLTDCTGYPSIYAAAIANRFGPLDHGTAQCLFSFSFSDSPSSNHNQRNTVIWVVVTLFVVFLFLGFGGFCFFWRRLGGKKRKIVSGRERSLALQMESISQSTTVVRYPFDDIREATKNFNRENIIGRGGYGNVYKGVLKDGSEVAMKRFKNCSEAGDPTFAHEVEVIASVRHVNLVALRGYCIATTPLEGHQRIIVCDLMKNGSLHDHLFGLWTEKLSWQVRQKIALGTARGLAYLHYGAQPGIFHRDIKASNILLDENFEPKVGDFGLAKFNPEGMTHLSTRVAGTMGYVAPEYALYGQVTERSDVYSFGVVFLELLSGKKAIMAVKDGQPSLVTEWAWDLVRKERTLDVIEDGMPDLGPPEVLEKYVLVAVLCSHPQLYARPTMDQVVKMLDMDLPVPSIPERPMPLNSTIDDIEKSMSSSGSGNLSTAAGYQPYTSENGRPLRPNKEGETSHNPLMHNKEEGQNSGTS